MTPDVASNGIGSKIKELRAERKLTLEKLAEQVGCSRAFLSQVENSSANPSITMLSKIAEALGVSVSQLFSATSGPQIASGKLSKSERRTIKYPDGKVESQLLTKGIAQKKMQPLLTYVQPGGSLDEGDAISHPPGSEEFVLIMKGELEFHIANEVIILKEGDTFYFDGATPHSWKNTGDQAAEVLFMWTPPVW